MLTPDKKYRTTVTPEKAAILWNKTNTFPAQRPVRRWKMLQYMEDMKNGSFREAPLVFAKHRGKSILMDGQHRLQAIAEGGFTFDLPIHTFNCKDMQEVTDLWSTFNVDMGRSRSDIAKAQAQQYGLNIHPVSLGWLVSCGTMLTNRSFNMNEKKMSKLKESTNAIKRYRATGKCLDDIYRRHLVYQSNRFARRVSVAFCIAHSYQNTNYERKFVTNFWDVMFTDVPPEYDIGHLRTDETHPSRVLRRTLMSAYSAQSKNWYDNTVGSREKIAILYQKAFKHYINNRHIKSMAIRKDTKFRW